MVNDATTNEDMLAALVSPHLYLDHPDFASLEDYELEIVAQHLLDNRQAGYADRDSIWQTFSDIIEMIIEDWYDIVADVNALKIVLAPGDTSKTITQDITLPTVGSKKGAAITWTSSNPAVISNTGLVTRPAQDTSVKLTALLTNRYEHYQVSVTLTVLGTESP